MSTRACWTDDSSQICERGQCFDASLQAEDVWSAGRTLVVQMSGQQDALLVELCGRDTMSLYLVVTERYDLLESSE